MPSPLVVGGRTKPARRHGFQCDPLEVTVEGKIEIKPRLFAVGDDVESGIELIANCHGDGVVDEFGPVGFAKFLEIP